MNDRAYQRLLRAAQNLIEAREDAMVTIDNWEALQKAVDECRRDQRSARTSQPPARPAPPEDNPRD